MSISKTGRRLAVSCAALAALVAVSAAPAQAWTSNHFYSPSRSVECRYVPNGGGAYQYIACESFSNGKVAVIYPTGRAVVVVDDLPQAHRMFSRYGSGPTLQYGETYTAGPLRCNIVQMGTQCWSHTSGRGFIINGRTGIARS